MSGIFGTKKFGGSFKSKDYEKFCSLIDQIIYRGPDTAEYLAYNSEMKEEKRDDFDAFF